MAVLNCVCENTKLEVVCDSANLPIVARVNFELALALYDAIVRINMGQNSFVYNVNSRIFEPFRQAYEIALVLSHTRNYFPKCNKINSW